MIEHKLIIQVKDVRMGYVKNAGSIGLLATI
jgi:hypothetical protein